METAGDKIIATNAPFKPHNQIKEVINKSVNKSTTNANNFTTFSSKEYPELKNADLSPLGINERGVDGIPDKTESGRLVTEDPIEIAN